MTPSRDATATLVMAQQAIEAQEFQEKLKLLHEISMELSQIAELDHLYLRVIELGRTRLDFDRLGLMLLSEDGREMMGTFGTDEQGHLRDERYFRAVVQDPVIMEVLNNRERVKVWQHTRLHDNNTVIGEGWNIMAALWDGDRSIGWLATDNWVKREPLKDYQVELLSLYARLVAQFIMRLWADAALKDSEALFKSVFDSAADAIMIFDTEGAIVQLNRSAERLLGIPLGRAIGQVIETFLPLDWHEVAPNQRVEMKAVRADGTRFPAEVAVSHLHQADQDLVMALIYDLTEREAARQAIQEKALMQMELEKEREVGELRSRFVSMVSHEFRTPLSTIKAAVGNLARNLDKMPIEERQDRFSRIHEQITHLTEMLDDVLLLGRYGQGRVPFMPQPLDLYGLLEKMVTAYQTVVEDTHTLTLACAEADRALRPLLDEKLMKQIINNLLSNASKYSSSGTTISVTLSCERNTLCLAVRDEGMGIPADDLTRMMEPFYRASNTTTIKGTGLGLAIVKRATEAHDGRVEIESVVKLGTVVRILIPLKERS